VGALAHEMVGLNGDIWEIILTLRVKSRLNHCFLLLLRYTMKNVFHHLVPVFAHERRTETIQ
jgi:hypothetical protein